MTVDTDARLDVILGGLLKYVREPMLASGFGLDSCIASTRIALDILEHFGVEAEPMPLAIFLLNEEAIQIVESGGTLEDIKEQTLKYDISHVGGPWSIGLGAAGDKRANRWAGHLVAALPQHKMLVDLSADQVARPQKDMPLEPIVWVVHDEDWWAGRELRSEPMIYRNDETGKRILAWFDRTDYGDDFDGYRRSTNWRRTSNVDKIATEISFRKIVKRAVERIEADINGETP